MIGLKFLSQSLYESFDIESFLINGSVIDNGLEGLIKKGSCLSDLPRLVRDIQGQGLESFHEEFQAPVTMSIQEIVYAADGSNSDFFIGIWEICEDGDGDVVEAGVDEFVLFYEIGDGLESDHE